jgi:hypothetical protein
MAKTWGQEGSDHPDQTEWDELCRHIFEFLISVDNIYINYYQCAAIYYSSATRSSKLSKLIDGCQGHPPFLPVAWDCLAAPEPGSETVYMRNTLFSQHL